MVKAEIRVSALVVAYPQSEGIPTLPTANIADQNFDVHCSLFGEAATLTKPFQEGAMDTVVIQKL